jgi:phage protein, HK97 gp10 family
VDHNYDKVKKSFDDLANSFEADVDAELNRIGDLMKDRASADAPRDTGYMADHIEKTETGRQSVTVTAIADYSGYVDQGTVKMQANPFFTGNVEKIESTELPRIEKNLGIKIDAKISIKR